MNDLSMAWLPEAEKQLHQSLTRKRVRAKRRVQNAALKLVSCLDVPYLVSLLTFNNFVTLTYWSIPHQMMNQVSLNTAPPKKLALLLAS
jgi:hypothetical protein